MVRASGCGKEMIDFKSASNSNQLALASAIEGKMPTIHARLAIASSKILQRSEPSSSKVVSMASAKTAGTSDLISKSSTAANVRPRLITCKEINLSAKKS